MEEKYEKYVKEIYKEYMGDIYYSFGEGVNKDIVHFLMRKIAELRYEIDVLKVEIK